MPGCATFSGDDRWTGWDDDRGFGQSTDPVGCAVHCIPCMLTTDVQAGVTDNGRRWLETTDDYPSRDAYGNFTPLRSVAPQLVPVLIDYRRAPCWLNRQSDGAPAGKECFVSFCLCDGQLDVNWGDEEQVGCREGVPAEALRTAAMPDDFFTWDHNLPSESSLMMDCRTEIPPQLGTIRVTSESGLETAYQAHSFRDHYCIWGLNALLYGMKVTSSRCYPGGDPHIYWNNNTRYRWRRWFVPDWSCRIAVPEIATLSALAAVEVQNTALQFVEDNRSGFFSIFHFDQVEMSSQDFARPNEHLPYWYRFFTPETDPPGPPPPELPEPVFPPVFLEFEGRTKFGRQPVRCEMTITHGLFLLHAVLAYIKHRLNSIHTPEDAEHEPNYEHQIWPSMRVRIALKFAVRAYPIPGIEYVARRPRADGTYEDVPLTIVNPQSRLSQDMPRLEPFGLDEIEYLLNGRLFTPPDSVEWLGATMALSSGQGIWQNRLTAADQETFRGSHTTENVCDLVGQRFREDDPVVVPGYPTEHDAANKITKFLGSVSFHLTD